MTTIRGIMALLFIIISCGLYFTYEPVFIEAIKWGAVYSFTLTFIYAAILVWVEETIEEHRENKKNGK